MNNEADLTSEQTEKVLQYQDLTGIDEFYECRLALERHAWDLEAAVQDQLNFREGHPSVFRSNQRDTVPLTIIDARNQQIITPSPTSVAWGWQYGGRLGFAASLIFRMLYNTVSSVFRFVYRFFRNSPSYSLDDPVGDVLNHTRRFEESFGTPHPVFYQGTYSQALLDAKHELRFLLVHLHSEEVPESAEFCRTTLKDPNVVTFLNSCNAIFWSCTVQSGEGQRVTRAVNPKVFPFIGVILPHSAKMVVVARFQGNIGPRALIEKLTHVFEASEPILQSARAQRMERSFNQSLRAAQDEAYLESLMADQEKRRKKQQAEDEVLRAKEEEKRREMEVRKKKAESISKVPPEPESDNSSTLCLLFKMPGGARIERRFLYSHTLKDVYHFILGQPELSDSFQVSTSYPKRILDCTETSHQTLKDAGLSPKEVLLIYDLES